MASVVAEQAPRPTTLSPRVFALASLAVIPVNFGVVCLALFMVGEGYWTAICFALFALLALVQLACGIVAVVTGLRERRATQGARGLWPAILGGASALGMPVLVALVVAFFLAFGKALADLAS